jgi:branched-chain amino acid transport system substrate-binding protein
VRAEYLDDAGGKDWDPATVGENARKATQDSSTAAYIGELDSQPTRASVPITSQAGLVQVSPGAGGVDLTRPAVGYPDSPDRYQPSGEPTFARVVPDDAAQASAAAELASEVGAKSVAAPAPKTPYGELTATEFERAAGEAGVEIVQAADRADAVLTPGEDGEMRLEGPGDHLIATPLDPARLAGREFAVQFEQRFERAPGPYAAYGFDAMELVLAAIEQAADADDDFRSRVVDAVLDAERPDSILGRYSITEDGDTTLCAIQPYTVEGGSPVAGKPICPSG